MPDNDDVIVPPRIHVPAEELDFTYARSGGPGGQNVNKVNSKAVLRWNAFTTRGVPPDILERFRNRYSTRVTESGDVVIHSDEHRDQRQNEAACLEKLAEMLRSVAVAPKVRRPTKPSAGSHRRRLADKRQRQSTKENRKPPRSDE